MSKLSLLWGAALSVATLSIAACAPSGPPPGQPPDIVLIVVDGLRADRLRPEPAPFLSALAESGVLFEGARTPAPWTRPTIASLFTGQSTPAHGVLTEADSDRLRSGPTLAEELAAAGYATLGVSANLHLAEPFGLQRGFDRFSVEHRSAAEVLAEASQMLEASASSPLVPLRLPDGHASAPGAFGRPSIGRRISPARHRRWTS